MDEPAFAGTDRFEIRRQLGRGGMGVVYEAFDRQQGATVALKTLITVDGETVLRFKNEFRALQDLTHPNLVGLHEMLEDQGRWFFTMDLVDGVDVYSYLRPELSGGRGGWLAVTSTATVKLPSGSSGSSGSTRVVTGSDRYHPPGPVDEARLRRTLGQVAAGLDALHAAHKVHRDIKPTNILVDRGDRAVILDFGIVAEAKQAAGRLLGTVAFMAPEQARLEPVGPAADWYAVGVLLYLALTGRLPHEGEYREVIRKKTELDAPAPRSFLPEISPELDALCRALLARDPARRPDGRELLRRLGVGVGSAAPAAVTGRAGDVFVGREQELAALRLACRGSLGREPAVVVVKGPSGIGKSALVRRFLAEPGEALVLSGRCYERESVPYKAVDQVIDALSTHLAALPPAQAAPLLPEDKGPLARVFPVLRQVEALAGAAAPDDAIEPRALRERVFAALRELFARLARARPVVVFIDDLQWTDADSLALLRHVFAAPAPPILLLGTVRGEAGAAEPALLAGLRTTTMELTTLDEADARALVVELCAPGERVDAEAIAAEAEGHPLFIEALVRYRLTRGAEAGPVRLDEAFRLRIDALPAAAGGVLALAAVAGLPIAQDTLGRASDLPLPDFFAAVAALRGARLLKTGGARPQDLIEPYHDRVRDSVAARLDAEGRRRLHLRLAEALEASPRPDAERLALHLREAGAPERAARWALDAAERAAAALAFERAVTLWRRALELPLAEADALRARVGLAAALTNAGRSAEAGAAYLDAADHAPPDRALDLRRQAADQLLRSGRLDEALATLRGLLPVVQLSWPRSPLRAVVGILLDGFKLRRRGLAFTPRRVDEIDPAVLRRADTLRSLARVLGTIDSIRGLYFVGRDVLEALDLGEPLRVGGAMATMTTHACTPGGVKAFARAREFLARGEAILAAHDDPLLAGQLCFARGSIPYFEGKWREAERIFAETAELFRGVLGGTFEVRTAESFRMQALGQLADLAELERVMPGAVRRSREHGDLYGATALRTGYGNLLWLARDDPAGLRADLDEALAEWGPTGFHLQHYYELYARAGSWLYQGDVRRAVAITAEAAGPMRRSMLLRIQSVRIGWTALGARVALAAGDHRRAAKLAGALDRQGLPWARAWAALVRACASGDAAALAAAAEACDQCDMWIAAAAARWRAATGAAGRAGRAAEEALLAGRGVAEPERMLRFAAPGSG